MSLNRSHQPPQTDPFIYLFLTPSENQPKITQSSSIFVSIPIRRTTVTATEKDLYCVVSRNFAGCLGHHRVLQFSIKQLSIGDTKPAPPYFRLGTSISTQIFASNSFVSEHTHTTPQRPRLIGIDKVEDTPSACATNSQRKQ